MSKLLATLILFSNLAFGQFGGRDPNWRTVGAGALSAIPTTCNANRDVYICNGAGCPANGGYYYCTATNTFAVGASGSSTTGGTTTPGYTPNGVVSGCGVEYTSGLSFTVGACSYTIAGAAYTSPLTVTTLAAADPTNPRIDVIGVNTSNVVFTITGTPAANPQQPTVDSSLQLQLTFVYVAATATTPSGVTVTTLYDENTEWTSAVTANINAASTVTPYHLTKDIEATAAVLGNNFTLVKPAAGTVDLGAQNNLTFYIQSKGAWPTGKSGGSAARYISLYWLNGATQKGTTVVLKDGQFGFSSSNTTSYQQIVIPTSAFGLAGVPVTTLEAIISGPSGTSSIGWFIDEVSLQSGVSQTTTTPTTHQISFVIDGGGTALTTGDIKVYPSVNFACANFTTATVSADQSGSVSIDVWKRNALIPTVTQKISGTTPLSLTAAQLNQNIAISAWNVPVTPNDIFGFSVASATTVTRVTGQIFCQ